MSKETIIEWEEVIDKKHVRCFVKNPDAKVKGTIHNKSVLGLVPFVVDEIGESQIMIDKKQYDSLKRETKDILKKYANKPVDHQGYLGCFSDEKMRFLKENYWTPSKSYIFEYEIKGYEIRYDCEYGYEGDMSPNKTIEFIDCNQYPKLILMNLGCFEGGEKKFKEKVKA